jgi:histidinol dehydrogenase
MIQPVKRAGVYVPGGKAVYPSTVLMAAIPAIVAGVREIIFCTPAGKDGEISPVVLAAMRSVKATGVTTRIFKLGGAVAIGAMAYGTPTVPQVDVIVGPGNDYVNIAKRIVYGDVGIDMLAGPSDVAIIADDGANPAFVAADVLAQTEHGPENRGVVISPSAAKLEAIQAEIVRQRDTLSRKAILELSAQNLIFVKTRDLIESVAIANAVAPEHLELQVRDPEALLPGIRNAGAVLLGDYTSAPIGDYLAGPSHTLPTGGSARFSSPLSVTTFLKRTSIISYSRDAAKEAAETVARFAEAEGFDAHASAARLRA